MGTPVTIALTDLAAASPVALLGDRPPLDPGWKGDNNLQDDLDAVITENPNLDRHAFAIVDLTDDPDPARTPGFGPKTPAYAGHRDAEQRKVGSLAKLLALYGAYSLRADLNALTTAVSLPSLAAAGPAIRQNYQRLTASAGTRPNVEHMFDPSGAPGSFNFTRSPQTDLQLDALYGHLTLDPNFANLTARECISLMCGWSENVAASDLILAMGFDYLWQLSRRSGLFRDEWDELTRNDTQKGAAGGLFLGQDFQGNIWQVKKKGGTRPPGAPIAPSNQAATARSVALLLAVLAQDQLVPDHAGNAGMREMLRKRNSNFTSINPANFGKPRNQWIPVKHTEGSPIGRGLAAAGWSASQIAWDEDITPVPPYDPKADLAVSKIGLVGDVVCNGLLVRTTRPATSGVTITAVLVGIDIVTGKWADLKTFGTEIAPRLALRHGVT